MFSGNTKEHCPQCNRIVTQSASKVNVYPAAIRDFQRFYIIFAHIRFLFWQEKRTTVYHNTPRTAKTLFTG